MLCVLCGVMRCCACCDAVFVVCSRRPELVDAGPEPPKSQAGSAAKPKAESGKSASAGKPQEKPQAKAEQPKAKGKAAAPKKPESNEDDDDVRIWLLLL